LAALKGSYILKDEHFVLKCSSLQIDLGEPLGLVRSYYYFLKKPLVEVNVFFLHMGGSWVLGFKLFRKGEL
jgi:hypothetical protein